MKSRLVLVLMGALLAFGQAGCKSKNTQQDEQISELATQEASNESLTEDLAQEVQKAKDMVVELRKELEARLSPEKVLEETTNWGTSVVYQCEREIPGYGVRSVFLLGNGVRAFCMEPHKGPPMLKCSKKAGTDYWICDDGTVQILKECRDCGCESTAVSPTAVPPTGTAPTETPKPCCTTEPPPTVAPPSATPTLGPCVPCTPVSPTVAPTPIPTQVLPTTQPTPYGTATCLPTRTYEPPPHCISSYELDALTGQRPGFWVQESSETCAFEHRTFPDKSPIPCPKGAKIGDFVCTVDNNGDVTVSEGIGQAYDQAFGETFRYMPVYPGENVCTVFRNEYNNSSRLGHPRMPRFVPVAGGIQSCP